MRWEPCLLGRRGRAGRGGHAQPEGLCLPAGSSRGRRAPAAGEGGACPEGTAGVGAVLARAAEPGSGSPLPPGLGARGGGNRGAETLGPEINGAQTPRHASRRLFWCARLGSPPRPVGCARRSWAGAPGPLLVAFGGRGWNGERPPMCVFSGTKREWESPN